MSAYKKYLGDGVYIDFDGYAVTLTTEDGISVQNTVYMEPTIVKNFQAYIEDLNRLQFSVRKVALND